MATPRTPNGSRKGARAGRQPANNRPGARGGGRLRTTPSVLVRPRFTSRMAVLVAVLAVLVVSYASSMRAYLQQRSHISELRTSIKKSETDIAVLEREKRRWKDHVYVETQARERFGWVLPGETSYQVIGRDGKPLERGGDLSDPDEVSLPVPEPWWDKVYGTLTEADHPKKAASPKSSISRQPPRNPTRNPTRDPTRDPTQDPTRSPSPTLER